MACQVHKQVLELAQDSSCLLPKDQGVEPFCSLLRTPPPHTAPGVSEAADEGEREQVAPSTKWEGGK